jgi:hypothetical protein
MAKTLQFRRGTTSELSSVTGAVGELFVDTTKDTVVVMDGSTAGGFPLQRELTAGSGIDITGNTISATGGSYGNAEVAAYLSNVNSITIGNTTMFGDGYGQPKLILNASNTTSTLYASNAVILDSINGNVYIPTGNITTPGIKTDNYYYANGSPVSFGGGSYGNAEVAAWLATSNVTQIGQNDPYSSHITFTSDLELVASSTAKVNATMGSIELNSGFGNVYVVQGNITTPGIKTDNYYYANGTPVSFGGGSYTLPIASDTILGGIKIGSGLSIDGNGVVTAEGGSGDADLSQVAEDILPLFSEVYDLGSTTKRWYDAYLSNTLNINDVTLTGSAGALTTTADVVVGSLLADQILITENMIVPDASTATEYSGGQGVVIVDGNMDIQGDWIKVPVVETINQNVVTQEDYVTFDAQISGVVVGETFYQFNFNFSSSAIAFFNNLNITDGFRFTLSGDEYVFTANGNDLGATIVGGDSVYFNSNSGSFTRNGIALPLGFYNLNDQSSTTFFNLNTTQEVVSTPSTTGAEGYIRYNQDVSSFEGHNGTAWGAIGGGGTTYTAGTGINITDDVISATAPPLTYSTGTATGNGTTTQFTIAAGRTVHDILVFVNGLCFTPTDDYTISGTTLTFTEAPSNLAEITFRYLPI